MILHNYIFTVRKQSCRKVMFLQVSVILFTGRVLSQHALQVASQHVLQQVSGGGIQACLAGFQAHTQGGSWGGSGQGGACSGGSACSQRVPALGGNCSLGRVPVPGVPAPRGVSCSWGGACPGRVWRPPCDGYCCGRYASYWNAFLFIIDLHHSY